MTTIGKAQDSTIGVGVDIGGAGVRATVFSRASDGAFTAQASEERAHAGHDLHEGLAECLAALSPHLSGTPVPVAIGAPGAKTSDGRGIERARNVASAPRLLDSLTRELAERGVSAFTLPRRLESDALAALLGETVVEGGRLRRVRDALFLGPGSGVAEAELRGGQPQRVEGPRLAAAPPTVLDGAFPDLEAEASLAGLAEAWRARCGPDAPEVETAAAAGDADARAALERFARALCRVIELRAPRLAALRASAGSPPALLVRTRRGSFFASAAVQAIVVPRLAGAAEACGAALVASGTPASPHAACAGALAFALRDLEPRSPR